MRNLRAVREADSRPHVVFSFEFFPPKTEAGEQRSSGRSASSRELAPSFVSVTYGAGGSTRARTVELVQRIQREARHRPRWRT